MDGPIIGTDISNRIILPSRTIVPLYRSNPKSIPQMY